MAIKRVFGTVDGIEVIMERTEGDRWSVPVPLDRDGEYVVEIIAEDEGGNQSYLAKMLYTVNAENICVYLLPMPGFFFERQTPDYQFYRVIPECKGVAL